MPDGDIFPGLHRAWRAVGRAVCGAQRPEVIASLAEKALAEQLRMDAAGLGKLGGAAAAIAHDRSPKALRHVVTEADLHASPLLRKLAVVARASSTLDEHDLVAMTLARMARDQLDSLRPKLVGRVFPSAADAQRYLDQCAGDIRVHQLADQVTQGNTRIRAPRRNRKSTADLLYESLT